MNVQYVPLEWVNSTWEKVEGFIASALAHSKGDYTVEQAKSLVTQGQWELLVAVEDGVIHGAATINFYNRPNDRVAFITAIGGRLISSKDTFGELRTFAKSKGATVLEGAARESVARLWNRYGFEEKHRVVGVRL